MRALELLNLLNSLGKKIKCSASLAFYFFSSTRLINSIDMSTHVRFSVYFQNFALI